MNAPMQRFSVESGPQLEAQIGSHSGRARKGCALACALLVLGAATACRRADSSGAKAKPVAASPPPLPSREPGKADHEPAQVPVAVPLAANAMPLKLATKRGASYHEWSCAIDAYYAKDSMLWREGDDVVVRWWTYGTCKQRLSPRTTYADGRIAIAIDRGPAAKCGQEVTEYFTRITGTDRNTQYQLVIDGVETSWTPAPEKPKRLPRPKCRTNEADTRNLDPWSQRGTHPAEYQAAKLSHTVKDWPPVRGVSSVVEF